ncbi:hypothetical protein ACFQ6V_26280 [Streptomyces roseifaciens]
MERTVIAKLEKGVRQTITVGELMVLARALEVSPVELVFPVGREAAVEVLPGVQADPWASLQWFTGEDDWLPGSPPDVEEGQDTETLRLYREHDQFVDDWWANRRGAEAIVSTGGRQDLRRFRSESDPDSVDAHRLQLFTSAMKNNEDAIRAVRRAMRDRGLTPPELGAEAAYIEEGPAEDRVRAAAHARGVGIEEARRQIRNDLGEDYTKGD